MILGSYKESVRQKDWCVVIESYLEDKVSHLLKESGYGVLEIRKLQPPQAIQYREWVSVQRAVKTLCRPYRDEPYGDSEP